MKKILFTVLAFMLFTLPGIVLGQEEDSTLVVDDIQFDLKSVTVKNDSLQIDLFAISYEKNPRDFRLNVFASALLDKEGESHMLSTIYMDRVMVKLSQRQNYLNYLMKQDVPVKIRLQVAPLTEEIKHAKEVKLVFESLEEEGRFLEAVIELKE